MIENRRSNRRPVRQGAFIFPGGGAPMIPCMMLDLSIDGARIQLDPDRQLPDQFILVLSRDGHLNRRCKIAWRKDDSIGVRFLSRESIAGPQRPKPMSWTKVSREIPEFGGEAKGPEAAAGHAQAGAEQK